MKPKQPQRVGESAPFGKSFQGERTWYSPSMENTYRSGLPEGMALNELTPAEVKAAIDLRIISPGTIDQDVVHQAYEVPREDVVKAARTLLKKVIGARPE